MVIEFTNKPTNYQNQESKLSFHDVFGESSKADTEPAKYDTTQPLVALLNFHSLFHFEGKSGKINPTGVGQPATSSSDENGESNLTDSQGKNKRAEDRPSNFAEVQRSNRAEVRPNNFADVQSTKNNAQFSLADNQQNGSLTERIVASISSHEGGFTSINNNDAGYGISVGIRQWNQKSGELPNLIRAWHDKHPSKFKQIFGEYTPNLLNEKWVRNYDMANDSQFMNSMKNALADRDLQRVQMEDAHKFVSNTTELAQKYGFQSEFGMALVCDMVNQMGPTGTDRALAKCGIRKNEGAIEDEHDAALRISRVRPDGKRFHNLLAQRFSPVLPGLTLA